MAISGFVIGFKGNYTVNRTTNTVNFGSLEVWLVPYSIYWDEYDPPLEKLNFDGQIIDGPASIQEHEKWHWNGMDANLRQQVEQKLGHPPKTGIGMIVPFNNAMAKIANDLGPENTNINDNGGALYNKLVQMIKDARASMTTGAAWHTDFPSKQGARFDVIIR
jgi:hypothetical protein